MRSEVGGLEGRKRRGGRRWLRLTGGQGVGGGGGREGAQEPADLEKAGAGFAFGEAGEAAGELKESAIAGEHQPAIAGFDGGDSEKAGEEAEFGDEEEEFDRRGRRTEAVAKILLQPAQIGGGGDLG